MPYFVSCSEFQIRCLKLYQNKRTQVPQTDSGKPLLVSHTNSFPDYLSRVEVSPEICCKALHTLILKFPIYLQSSFYLFEAAYNSCHRLIKMQTVGVPLPKFPVSRLSKWEIPRANPTQILGTSLAKCICFLRLFYLQNKAWGSSYLVPRILTKKG